jgi:hypothetical protein
MKLKWAHRIAGIGALAAFIATGQYMHFWQGHLRGLDEATRMLFRSTHIYILLAGVINLMLGLYYSPHQTPWKRSFQRLGSSLILMSPFLLLSAFCVEPHLQGLPRPWSRPALYGIFAGALFHFIAGFQPTNGPHET